MVKLSEVEKARRKIARLEIELQLVKAQKAEVEKLFVKRADFLEDTMRNQAIRIRNLELFLQGQNVG